MDAAIWPSARKYPPNAGPDVRPSVFSCYGVPLRAWDGYPLLRGRPVHRPPGQTCFQDNWDTVDSGSEEQAYVFSPATLSTLVQLHDTSGYSR